MMILQKRIKVMPTLTLNKRSKLLLSLLRAATMAMFKVYNLWLPLLLKKPPPLPASLVHSSLSLQVEVMEALVVVEMEMVMVEMEGVETETETEATLLVFLQDQLVRSTLVLLESLQSVLTLKKFLSPLAHLVV